MSQCNNFAAYKSTRRHPKKKREIDQIIPLSFLYPHEMNIKEVTF